VLHHPPSFIDNQNALLQFAAHNIPNVIDDGINSNGAQFIFQIRTENTPIGWTSHIGFVVQQAGEVPSVNFLDADPDRRHPPCRQNLSESDITGASILVKSKSG
jgi:hypothetical protein